MNEIINLAKRAAVPGLLGYAGMRGAQAVFKPKSEFGQLAVAIGGAIGGVALSFKIG